MQSKNNIYEVLLMENDVLNNELLEVYHNNRLISGAEYNVRV